MQETRISTGINGALNKDTRIMIEIIQNKSTSCDEDVKSMMKRMIELGMPLYGLYAALVDEELLCVPSRGFDPDYHNVIINSDDDEGL